MSARLPHQWSAGLLGDSLSPVGGGAVERTVEPHRLTHFELIGQFGLLKLGTHQVSHPGTVVTRTHATDPDGAAVWSPQAQQTFHRGGLLRSVRAENPKNLALLYGEADVVNHSALAVALDQLINLNHFHTQSMVG